LTAAQLWLQAPSPQHAVPQTCGPTSYSSRGSRTDFLPPLALALQIEPTDALRD